MNEVFVMLTETIRDNFRNARLKQSLLPCLGEFLFYAATQEETDGKVNENWEVPSKFTNQVPMQRKIQLCFHDPAWYFLMCWISWCYRFFNYGKGKYCNPRSNINILIPKMSGVWDRIRSLVTSHVGVMLGRSNISHCLCHCFFISHCLRVQRVTSSECWSGQNLCNFVIFTLNIIAPWDSAHQEVPSGVIKTE